MTIRLKLALMLGAFVSATVAAYGAKVLLSLAIDPILRAVGS